MIPAWNSPFSLLQSGMVYVPFPLSKLVLNSPSIIVPFMHSIFPWPFSSPSMKLPEYIVFDFTIAPKPFNKLSFSIPSVSFPLAEI